ncbi:MAG: class I tRNA ligase family protein, partial [Gammaproteobacteria bacterium]|nr:class I tRNA ligase family protein [Gammaproteobacteria bacterium]
GGAEHAVLHLLYARFWHKLMRDEGLIANDEPFTRLLTQGMVLKDGSKMSKSKGNTVDPQGLIEKYGADTVRLFTMFAAPPEQSLEWNDSGVEGASRFLKRVWAFANTHQAIITAANKNGLESFDWSTASEVQQTARREIHEQLKQATFDFGKYQFNTVVAACMKIMNSLHGLDDGDNEVSNEIRREGLGILLSLLAPIAPHMPHQLWQSLAYGDDVLLACWPVVDESALKRDNIELVVQVNGKVRCKIAVSANADKAAVEAAAQADVNVQRFTEGKTVVKIIVVPGRLVNVVVK